MSLSEGTQALDFYIGFVTLDNLVGFAELWFFRCPTTYKESGYSDNV